MPLDSAPIVEIDPVTRLLERALERLTTYGWCQDNLWDRTNGEMCLLGALCLEQVDSRWCDPGGYNSVLVKAAERMGFARLSDMTNWNDRGCRTKEEALARLKTAIWESTR